MTLYTKECPKCIILKEKLEQKGLSFTIEDSDFTKLTDAGIDSIPVLEVDGRLLLFNDAVQYVNNYKKEG